MEKTSPSVKKTLLSAMKWLEALLVIAVYGAVSMLYVPLRPGRDGPPAPGPPAGDGRPRGARGAHVAAPSEAGTGDGSVEVPAGKHLRSSSVRKK